MLVHVVVSDEYADLRNCARELTARLVLRAYFSLIFFFPVIKAMRSLKVFWVDCRYYARLDK